MTDASIEPNSEASTMSPSTRASTETFSERALTISFTIDDKIMVVFSGESTAREPGLFVLPILTRALDEARNHGKALVVDFRELGYMNSSTITPLIRVLDQVRQDDTRVRVVYRKDLKWQALSFTALQVFQTADLRIQVEGV